MFSLTRINITLLFQCNKCEAWKFVWQFHWRIKNGERLKVCKKCRNEVNQELKK